MRFRLDTALAASLAVLGMSGAAAAFDLTGAWANDLAACSKIFAHKGGSTVFKEKSDVYGSGFIVDGDRVRGRFARCRITSRKDSGEVLNLLAACSTDIMLSNVQFALRVKNDDTIVREFPGMEGISVQYVRCPSR